MTDSITSITDVRAAHRFDLPSLAEWLGRNVDGFFGPLEVAQFSGGQSNPTYLLTTPSQRYVLRRKPSGTLLPSAHAIDREYRLLNALRSSPVPTAEVFCYCDDPSVIGSEFYLMEYVQGRVLWDSRLPGMLATERRAIFDEMNRVIAALHTLDVDAVGLRDYGKTGNYFERQVSRWIKQYRASETHRIESVERLIEWLPKHMPADRSTTLVHGDFRIDNMIFDATEPRTVAVLDWELSTLGDPVADFSYLCLAWHLPSQGFRGLAGSSDSELASMGIPLEREFLAQYCQRTGIAEVSDREWNFYHAYNLFRGAGILQGIMKRALDGNASSDQAFEYGKRATVMADIGWSCAERAMAA
jgi:aminoglycoside phosphotransferase (APT) family kinase protein